MATYTHLTEGRVHAALGRIGRLIYPERLAIDCAVWTVGGEPVPPEKAFRAKYVPCAVGEPWGALWDTCWFRFRGKVPASWRGRRVVALVRLTDMGGEGFTAEGLVFQDGLPTRAVNVNRAEVEIIASARGGERFEFFVEAAANASVPDGFRTALNLPDFGGQPLFRLEQAELACVNREAFAYYHDFAVCLEAMENLASDGPRRAALREALNVSLNILKEEIPSTIAPARAALKPVLSRKNGDTSHSISAIGHAHIDTAWLWPLRESIRKCARTFATALDLMRRYPDYVFCSSSAQHYAWMKQFYPSIWEGIRKAVRRGQWEVLGSMWIEADCNLASGESLVRQILHGKTFFERELGIETKDLWLPDVFGYSAALPQIMAQSGIEYFLTQKISWNQFNRFPHQTFWWEGIDGSRIFTHFPPADTYNAKTGPAELLKSERAHRDHGRSDRSLLVYGYGDGGGGPSVPMLENCVRLHDFEGLPRLQQEKALAFFEKARKEAGELPVWVGELYLELHRGTYTTQAKNKLGNRKSEFLLRDAEFLDAVSMAIAPRRSERLSVPERAAYDVGAIEHPRPESHAAALERAWKLVLLNQFHDIIPGSSIAWVYQDSARDYATVSELGEGVRSSSLDALSPHIDTSGFSRPLIAWNPLGFRRREVVNLPGGDPVSVDVPPLGYSVVDGGDEFLGRTDAPVLVSRARTGITLDNGVLRLRINPSGHLASVFDHRARREVLPSGELGNVFHLHRDLPNRWEAWDVDIFYKETCEVLSEAETVEVVEESPLRAAVRVVRVFGSSRIEQRIVLCAGSARVDFPTVVEWAEERKFLKVAFPVNVRSASATYEIQYGHAERPTHSNTSWDIARFEVCAQKWADLSESGYGVALLNDCKYGYDIVGNVMRLSLLRAPCSPDPTADRGRHEFVYALLPHSGDFRRGHVIEESYALNAPIRCLPAKKQRGELPPSHSFFRVEPASAVVETVKVGEDGASVIVRLYEAHGGRGVVRLSTTLPVSKACRTDLMERPTGNLVLRGGEVRFDLTPFEIATVKFTLSPKRATPLN